MHSIVDSWPDFKSYVAAVGPERGSPERPAVCPRCDFTRVWFNGWCWVFCVVLVDGTVHRFGDGLPLRRCICARCHARWTMRPSFLYPHRSFEPDVVEAAGAAYLSAATATYRSIAARYQCSARSVWRWVSWLATLVSVPALLAKVERLVGGGHSANLIPRGVPSVEVKARSAKRAATLVLSFQVLAALAIWHRAQAAPPLAASPVRFWLVERFRVFREVYQLTTGP